MSDQTLVSNDLWPNQITLKKDRRTLQIDWENGRQTQLHAQKLRRHSPSAEARGHSHNPKPLPVIPSDIEILGVEPVGNYAVRLRFSDGHSTGIYQWAYLEELKAE